MSLYSEKHGHETPEARMARLRIVRLIASGHIWRGINAALAWARQNPE